MEGEQERLVRMYGELGEEHLRDLYDDRESLTLDGQMALAKVMQAKGLVAKPAAMGEAPGVEAAHPASEFESGFGPGIPGMFPGGAGAMEKALDAGGERREGMVNLITFFDGHELSRACEALDSARYDFALEPLERDALSGAPSSLAIWVEEARRSECEALLREKMGLFPLGETGEDVVYDDGMMTLGEFETADEAQRVHGILTGAGIVSTLEQDEDGTHFVEVKGTDLERGLSVVSSAMNLS